MCSDEIPQTIIERIQIIINVDMRFKLCWVYLT